VGKPSFIVDFSDGFLEGRGLRQHKKADVVFRKKFHAAEAA
jgi:hypothetical protein